MTSAADAIKQFNKKVTNLVGDEFQARCISLSNDVILNTPVDTGRLRANWIGSIDKPATGTFGEGGDEATAASIAMSRLASAIARLKPTQAFYLSNNVPYARIVEEGDEKRRPARMLARAIQKATNDLDISL